jgi:nucleoside-diphosphate-sugar epimerase
MQVVVTGGSGFVGSWVVAELLKRGYKVKTTVRDVNDAKKTAHLRALENAEQNLTFQQADLFDEEEKYVEIFKGINGLFHTASPFFRTVEDPETQLIQPAIQGTTTIISAAIKANIKNIVLTSSMAAVAYNQKIDVYNEDSWSDEDYQLESKAYYALGKTRAEKAAWKMVNDYNLSVQDDKEKVKLTVVNPTLVYGPLLQPSLNTSAEMLLEFLVCLFFFSITFSSSDL